MLQKREIWLLVAGILVGVVVGLVAGYGIHDSLAQGDMSGPVGTRSNGGQMIVQNSGAFPDHFACIDIDGTYYGAK